ncbi:hypothetical protein SJAV_21880 [Sulfurisphaera javensis]|uniref:Uncharacterized protein n=1 Tax=Sulfurisphaera javensis TaxID=2049879 RepID=A0AAT9GTT8_9CREN
MLIKFELTGKEIFPSQVTGSFAYKTNLILIIRLIQGKRVLFIDYISPPQHLGSYEPPPFLSGKIFFYEIIEIPEEYSPFIKCIAREAENKLSPLFKNKKLHCDKEVTVVIE